jgi:hypothetical protein
VAQGGFEVSNLEHDFQTPQPNKADIMAHLSALFPPDFVHPYPDALIEIAYGMPDGKLDKAELFSAFKLEAAADFAITKNRRGCNVYVGPTLKKGDTPPFARTNDADFLAGLWSWTDHDAEGDFETARTKAKELHLAPGMIVQTGTVPHRRAHVYYKIAGGVTDREELERINKSVIGCLGGDAVQNAGRVLRLAGTVNYPSPKKRGRGYVVEAVTVLAQRAPREHAKAALAGLCPPSPGASATDNGSRKDDFGFGSDDFWRSVNSLALDKLGSWVPDIFPNARFEKGTGAWRISSRDLGRDREEDLSISPKGIKDWGVWDVGDARQGRRTAIDIVKDHGGKRDAKEAALWLCESCGVDPATLGWRGAGDAGGEQKAERSDAGPLPRLLVSSGNFVAEFVPPDYAIDGLVQRRYLYSLTANTGHGKTAVALLLTLLKTLGRKLADREIDAGHVLYFAGENPDDVRARWIALCERFGVDPNKLNVHFLPGTGKLSDIAPRIEQEVRELGCDISFVVIDTSIAYFDGDEENNNVQAVSHARRMRTLLQLPGGPCVVVLCHPIKNAQKDNLLPRGGGAFLNEVDGNLTCWNDDGVVKLHHLGKFRGPDFAPITFQLETVTTPRLKDSKGRLMPTVIAKALSEAEERRADDRSRDEEDAFLLALDEHPRASFAGLAVALGWITSKGENKAKVRRCADKLKKEKLVTADRRGALSLTDKGVAEVKELRSKGCVKI